MPQVNETLDRVQKAVEEFFKKTRTTLFEFDKARGTPSVVFERGDDLCFSGECCLIFGFNFLLGLV